MTTERLLLMIKFVLSRKSWGLDKLYHLSWAWHFHSDGTDDGISKCDLLIFPKMHQHFQTQATSFFQVANICMLQRDSRPITSKKSTLREWKICGIQYSRVWKFIHYIGLWVLVFNQPSRKHHLLGLGVVSKKMS